MKRLAKSLVALSLLLSIASFVTCHFGAQHEINKIPPEIRARMSDFGWIGVEWIGIGTLILFVAIISAVIALSVWLINQRHARRARAGTE
jgi:hypothetical protein